MSLALEDAVLFYFFPEEDALKEGDAWLAAGGAMEAMELP